MQLKSILNRVQLHQGFVYGAARWREQGKRPILDIEIRSRRNGRPLCSVCGTSAPGYDTLPVRRFEFVPLWGIATPYEQGHRQGTSDGSQDSQSPGQGTGPETQPLVPAQAAVPPGSATDMTPSDLGQGEVDGS